METADLEYVGFWPRVGAALIDSVIVLLVTSPILVSIYGWSYFTESNSPLISGPADFLISWVLPCVATIWFWRAFEATPGKMVISARVVDARTGATASVGQCIGRYLAYFISTLVLLLGLIWVGFDPRKQGWHDKIAGTVVVRRSKRHPEPVRFDRA